MRRAPGRVASHVAEQHGHADVASDPIPSAIDPHRESHDVRMSALLRDAVMPLRVKGRVVEVN